MSIGLFRGHRGEAGDTIVEVIMAVAVVSGVLIGAFALTQKSTLATRDAQEHSAGQQIAQSQIEGLRAASQDATKSHLIFSGLGSTFCIDGSGTPIALSGNCSFAADGTVADSTTTPAYATKVVRSSCMPSNPTCGNFTVTVMWASITGHSQGKIDMSYRVYGVAP